MPCPHRSADAPSTGGSRRDFLKTALAIGGISALSACVERYGPTEVPAGPDDLSALPERQHAWNEYLQRDSHWNTVLPSHQLVLLLRYVGDGPPSDAEREQVERAFRTLERAYQRGNGGANPFGAEADSEGLLFTVGYAPRYFERFDAPLPESVDLPRPEALLAELGEDETAVDGADAAMMLCSETPQALLAVENALFGNLDRLNGVDVAGNFVGVFGRAERRTGFIGTNLPSDKLDVEAIPERSPQAMGYKSGLRGNQASEDRVTIDDGPFAGGTTQQISRLSMDLETWYENDEETRVEEMFSPHHTLDQVGEVGEFLAGDSGVTRDIAEKTAEDARERGVVGHTQKLAMARDENFEPLILRRSEGVATDPAGAAMNFSSVQEGIGDFAETRRAMDGNLDEDVSCPHSGILDYIEVHSRGTYLVPPRSLRALPTPNPEGGADAN